MSRDLTKTCRMGFEMPLDRVPSDGDGRAAFTIGHWCRLRSLDPVSLSARTDPLLGDLYRLTCHGVVFLLQLWPHPQNASQSLVVVQNTELWRG